MPWIRGVVAVVLALLLAGAGGAGAGTPKFVAVDGRVDLPAALQEPVSLEGQWGFAWQQFVDPRWERLPVTAFAPVPSSWNNVTAGGKPPGENGWGSYLLQVNCPPGESLAVEAVGQRTASRLFVNGTAVAAHGEPGPAPASSPAAVHNRVPITREFACPLRITLHVSNFAHRAGGFVRPLTVGPHEALEGRRESRVIYATGLLTAYLVTGVVALIFYAARRRERVPLVFGLFCIAMAVYTDMISERLFLRPLPAQVPWAEYMRVEYLSWLAAMALFFLTLRGLFPAEIHRRVVQAVLGAVGAAAVAVVVLPPGVYSYLALPGQAIAVLVAAYLAAAMVRAQARSRGDARVLLGGMLAVLATLALDLLLIDSPGRPDQKFAQFGFALFLLSPAVVIARRMTQALNAEERSRTLEENARLREDVERISRHDLKTPLNSILNAGRLLHDDRRLTADQQELVGVVQGAGLRMLEMVNLSLGLFKMETGTYEFQPQAVDLRDVVSRVLVDLGAYAQAHGVTLHWQDADRGTAHARAEELLCYSIVANLVKNAIEAAGTGQQVSITLRGDDPLALAIHNPGAVPPEVAGRFFDKYVTGRKSGGTGLGTYSARLMAKAQHGDLRMHTGAQGTTVTLTLPRMKGVAPARAGGSPGPGREPDWSHAFPPRDLLLVDDDEFTRLVTRRMLPSPPFRVATAANGQAAIEAMAASWPQYLLVDMEMPLMGGVETVRWLREQERVDERPRCRVVMLSGNDDETSAALALQAGADRFLVKPVTRERLLNALRELEATFAAETPAGPMAAMRTPAPPAQGQRAGFADAQKVPIARQWEEDFPEALRLQRETVSSMLAALAAGDREQLQFIAHRAYGALAAMGLEWAARQCRRLEREALDAGAQELREHIRALAEHLDKVQPEYR